MNNKPVAWMDEINTFVLDKDYQQFPKSLQNGMIPLYTHPVKDLEDIDINITWNENSMRDFGKDELAFARAILKKAQEK